MLNINYAVEPMVITKIGVKLDDIIESEKVSTIEDKFIEMIKESYGQEENNGMITSNFKVSGDKLIIECINYNTTDYESNKKIAEMKLSLTDVLFTEMGLENNNQIKITKTELVESPDSDDLEYDEDYFDPYVTVSIKMTPDYYNTIWTDNEVERFESPETLETVAGQKIDPIIVDNEQVEDILSIEQQYLSSLFASAGIPQELVDQVVDEECNCEGDEPRVGNDKMRESLLNRATSLMDLDFDSIKDRLSKKLGLTNDMIDKVVQLILSSKANDKEASINDIDVSSLTEEQVNAINHLLITLQKRDGMSLFVDNEGNCYTEEEVEKIKKEEEERKSNMEKDKVTDEKEVTVEVSVKEKNTESTVRPGPDCIYGEDDPRL
jgi:hypothetical protein